MPKSAWRSNGRVERKHGDQIGGRTNNLAGRRVVVTSALRGEEAPRAVKQRVRLGSGSAPTRGQLQTLVLPTDANADRIALFARWPRGGVRCVDQRGVLPLDKGKLLDLGTFFNAFSFRKWHYLTDLNSVSLRLHGLGRVRVRVQTVFHSALGRDVASCEGELQDEIDLPLPSLASLPGQILACDIEALSDDVIISGGSWRTSERPKRDVRLAAVITTFKREEALSAAVTNFLAEAMTPLTPEELHLFVVDNGGTADLPDHERITLIRNRNLGGAGGFTRGLLAAMERTCFTHCLFMDDDASCEPESVWRAMALLAHASDARLSVAGAMLLRDPPMIQAEKGARLATDGTRKWYYEAVHHYWDLTDLGGIACNDDDDQANYGAWWFFAFPLAAVRHLPFPFFVRGDDVDFSLSNELPITTMNGIAARCDSFSTKLVAQMEFLASRAWFALALRHGDLPCARACLTQSLKNAYRFGLRFDYASMEATLEGLRFVMIGPSAFGAEPAPVERLAAIRARSHFEPVTVEIIESAQTAPGRSQMKERLVRLLSQVTLGGHLWSRPRPEDHRVVYARHAWDMHPTGLIGAERFMFGRRDELRCLRRDRKRMRDAMKIWLQLYLTSTKKLKTLQRSYKDDASQYRNRTYWTGQFESEPDGTERSGNMR